MHRCASIAPFLLRPRRKPCQFGEKCSSPPSETVSLTIAAKRLFHQVQRTWIMRVPSLLSVRFACQSGCRWSSAHCMVCGMLVARVPGQRPTPTSHECTFLFFFFVNSSTPMPSSRSHRQIRWRCAHEKELYWCTTAWRCLAPASLRQLLCCAEENPFRSRHHIHVPRLERRHIRLEFSQRFLEAS